MAKKQKNLNSKDNALFSEIDTVIGNYRTRFVELNMGLNFSMYNTLRQIDFYYNSQYLGGNFDALGREKPFRNINKFRVNVAMRATDIDIKDCNVTADLPSSVAQSFILNHELYEWMKEADFDVTLNDIGYNLPKYGGVVVKRCIETDEDGEEELKIEVPAWKNMVVDQIDFDSGVKIERHWLPVKEVWDKKDVWMNVPEAVKLASKIRQNVTNNGINTQGNTKEVQVLEVEGYFSDAMNPTVESDDESVYRLMHFMIATNNSEYILLFGEEIEESRYKFLAYDKVAGRSLGVGVVEDGFQAQIWTNDAVIAEKNAMELAGKVLLKTNSKKVGSNVLTDADNGRIYEIEDGKDITPINLMPSALPQWSNIINAWDSQYERVSSTFNAITGEAMPSGTPYRQTAILNQEAGSLFDYRRKEKGNFVAEIINDWVLPFLIEKLNTQHILVSEYSQEELAKIDESFGRYTATQELINKTIAGEVVTPEDFKMMEDSAKQELTDKLGKKRYLDVPKGYFKGFEGRVSVNVAGELKNKSATLESLNNILMTVAKVPNVLTDPALKGIFSQIMEMSGAYSPLSLTSQAAQPEQAPSAGMDMSALAGQAGAMPAGVPQQ